MKTAPLRKYQRITLTDAYTNKKTKHHEKPEDVWEGSKQGGQAACE